MSTTNNMRKMIKLMEVATGEANPYTPAGVQEDDPNREQTDEMDSFSPHQDVRVITNKLHEHMDEGILDPRAVADAALAYMSEFDIADMARSNELIRDEDEEEDYSDDMRDTPHFDMGR